MIRTTWVPALSAVLLLGGCATLHPSEIPELSVVNLRVADMTLFETSAEFQVRVTNAQPDPLLLEGGSVKISLSGVRVGRGLIGEAVEVPALDSVVVTVPVFINHLAVATRLQKILEQNRVDYRIDGVLYGERTLGISRRFRSSHEGTFEFRPPREIEHEESAPR